MEGKRLIGTIFLCILALFRIFKSLNKTDSIFVYGSENVTSVLTPFFYWTDPLLYHNFWTIVIFLSGNSYSLCSQGKQHYQKVIYFLIFSLKS